MPLRDPSSTRAVYGVDFSGAQDAGRRIWIAWGACTGSDLAIERCLPAQDLPGSGRGRDQALGALRSFVENHPHGVFGMDFPFGLPAEVVDHQDWPTFALAVSQRYPTPETFRDACRRQAGHRELRRRTDLQSRAPFAPYNLRVYRQTYYGLRDLLGPLVAGMRASVLPMQAPIPNLPWIVETCPASLLKAAGQYRPYKGPGDWRRVARERMVEYLEQEEGLAFVHQALREQVIDNQEGDALDSVLAALGAQKALEQVVAGDLPQDPISLLEGYIFF
jgi:hypothetical protein